MVRRGVRVVCGAVCAGSRQCVVQAQAGENGSSGGARCGGVRCGVVSNQVV